MRFKITEGPVKRPQRLLLYGPEGIGKSTLASQMPDPIFIDAEDGTGHLCAMRLEQPRDWEMLLAEVDALASDPSGASTVVIDTADAAERMCQAYVCKKFRKGSVEDWGYGRGYVLAKGEYQSLLDALDRCVARGLNVVVVAHSQMRKFERPDESGAYDRFELKLNKHVSALVKEWADAVLFIDWEVFVSTDENGKARASGGKRVVRCDHSPVWDAKNRWGLPPKMPLDSDGVAAIRNNLTVRDGGPAPAPAPEPEPEPQADAVPPEPVQTADYLKEEAARRKRMHQRKYFEPVLKLMNEDGVTVEELEAVMVRRGKRQAGNPMEEWEEPFVGWLAKQWKAVVPLVKGLRDDRKVAEATDVPF